MSPRHRTTLMFAVIFGALVIVFFWNRHERAAELADQPPPPAGSSSPTISSREGSSAPVPSAGSAERVRKIDNQTRKRILDRIATARSARTSGTAAASSSTPSLPALPGTIHKDDIRAGVRAVIPLLAECYDAAQERLSIKEGKIVVQMHLTGEPEVGTVIEKAEIEGDAHFTKDAELVECLQQTMLSVELPPIDGGGTVDVTYPIAFAPG